MVFEIKIEERKRFGLVSVNNAFERLKQQGIGPTHPGAKFRVIQPRWQFAEAIQVEATFGYSKAEPCGVNGVNLLFNVVFHWHQEHGFAEPGCFTN